MMMAKSVYVITLALIVSTTGFKISSTCVDICKSASSLYCTNQCELDSLSLAAKFGQVAVDKCLRSCRCGEQDLAYPGDEDCERLQILAVNQASCRCVRPKNLKLKTRSAIAAAAVTNPWENWCKHQCEQGLGGSACYCDIIP